ncbi:MAG: ABC transporter ATP-binding protein [Clostridia bacterium]|nr:ABC transporter ATP-binding protein [Clostridia bacterium]
MSISAKSVKLDGLTKVFVSPGGAQAAAADNVCLTINEGELVTFLGPSGCGKTTTLRMVAGFENPTSGRVLIGDRDVTNVAPNNRDTAMVFQSYALFPHMTVGENVAYGLRFRKAGNAEKHERTKRMMELVGLTGFESRQPGQLSGGQQQRVALARALVVEPQVLLFDEPLSNLDAKLREQMREEIRRIQQRLSITAIYVTHDQSEAMAISDRIVIMNRGRIEQVGTPREVYSEPISRFVADFIGRVNFLPGLMVGCVRTPAALPVQQAGAASGRDFFRVNLFGQEILVEGVAGLDEKASECGGRVLVVCRPEAASLARADTGEEPPAHTSGRVIKAVYFGSYMEYGLELDGMDAGSPPFTLIDHNPARSTPLEVGDTAGIRFDENSLHVLAAE